MIPVNQPFLPPKSAYIEMIDEVWDRSWLTNNGPNLRLLEENIQKFLGLNNKPVVVNNGTIALQIAIKSLGLKGEIITTPFSYVATASSIVWENCKPVFADIDPETFNIAPSSIEKLISKNTTAILGTHVFGNPCNISEIDGLAKKNQLKVIYDAAHAFAVDYNNQSVFEYGDISTTSLHATKLYHSVEGGFIASPHSELTRTFELMRNFGHDGPYKFSTLGINGKNSELHAAMGLINLQFLDKILAKRKELVETYENGLADLPISFQRWNDKATRNYSYMPILFESEDQLVATEKHLESKEIFTRRYFYPTLDHLPYLNEDDQLVTAKSVASCIMCLPLYYDLEISNAEKVIEVIRDSF